MASFSKKKISETINNEPAGSNANEKSKAHIYNLIIVDESGSMRRLVKPTLSGINETIQTIKDAQKEFSKTQKHTLTLVTFDTNSYRPDVRTIINNKPIEMVEEFKDYNPFGSTPLYDAMGKSLTELHERIKNDEDVTAVVTVLTDGMENSSRKWRASELRLLIRQLKEEGWTFSYMGSGHNVKEVTYMLDIDNIVEFSHDELGVENTWANERSSRRSYYDKLNSMYSEPIRRSKMEILEEKKRYAREFYLSKITPNNIRHLDENEIFVFGSNAQGHHGGGAAAVAMREFGAVWGQCEGLQGQSYAIPTMEGLRAMEEAVNRFLNFAECHPNMKFLVTRIGCGIAGYSPREIAPLFRQCVNMQNVTLPEDFWLVLGLTF